MDSVADERQLGIEAGLNWRFVAEARSSTKISGSRRG